MAKTHPTPHASEREIWTHCTENHGSTLEGRCPATPLTSCIFNIDSLHEEEIQKSIIRVTGNVYAVTETAHNWMEVSIIGGLCLLWSFGRGEMEREYKCNMKKNCLTVTRKLLKNNEYDSI